MDMPMLRQNVIIVTKKWHIRKFCRSLKKDFKEKSFKRSPPMQLVLLKLKMKVINIK